ncbi:lycopene cyclase [Actinocatenispora thailandica]|uniref:Lycopene cyclase n=1 Tax=Actinocatenispora thailandica TaxID=227318 RepID=A0A7R7DWN7_9ACTN|nr:lycopene cyclase domain-containing protein [Actinocatenispora thailandica]BCJ39253.1 lycopene cyclase [Actinocatenispora thailandica]
MDGWQYLAVLALCVAVTVPLEFVLGARVYRRPRVLLATLAPVVVLFGGWDLFGAYRGDWWYGIRQTLGVRLLGLPVEEWLFFLVVPLCAVLTFEALGTGRGRRDR